MVNEEFVGFSEINFIGCFKNIVFNFGFVL